jgi:DNA-binding transcriptional MerR regulator
MFKIGDFSQICRVPVSALRYYADIGLLEPARIDPFTSYRYYSLEQLPQLNRILAFKDLGLSLEQIKRLLDDNVTPDEIRGMLKLRQAEIQQHIEDEAARLARVAARLKQIEQEGKMPDQEVILKQLASQPVLAIREVLPGPQHVGVIFGEVFPLLAAKGIPVSAPALTIYHDEAFTPENVDVEVVFPVAKVLTDSIPLESGRQLKAYELPGVETAACIIHRGTFDHVDETYSALGKWIEANSYRIDGPPREVYLTPGVGPDAITEIQFPVAKA